ncbi:fumarylacetoacetate hydrolase family protein [Conexibacter stalactiti]|uniref:Fumarylacetoacetate hydrolase family protein n=1 Tax=Conexibacter stalactiti TaxID=1940611 RepID=A0ABU4HVT2_9ACTN|nr:fumarylacetoacetate hydrolase family protein [Conexibacter stalactiti]MDW5597328.1 fumarylacetoacetate hydrolase family protein [Conexibacter stalactiti]MEC5037970.1 fumarylacetoacetate hydrolase family protein [Conexibacter stalactiti]
MTEARALDDQAVAAEAALLLEAERTRVAIEPITGRHPAVTIADAYAIQLAGRELRLARPGAALVGRKVGLTSAVMQQMMGVDQPDFGYLTAAMISADGATLDPAAFLAPRVEAEIAFRLKAPLAGAELTIADVLAATEAVAPALEVIDSRVADWRIKIADTIADNASSGHVVLGAWQPVGVLDLAAVEVSLEVAPEGEANSGTGAAVLGHPAAPIVWLARALHDYGGEGIAAGEIVIPGAVSRALPVAPGQRATARFAGLGEVSATFEAVA